ncbi:MAG: hypothetical protein DI539_29605 [Flavobacterium psychrophilum]|nr:MAG: hypothetical protein DI539_29605 [Flavobacterium psychrophilum]
MGGSRKVATYSIEVTLTYILLIEINFFRKRADIFLHAADLCASKYRMDLNAATMLGQGKNIVQAEIDSACEIVDFLRFNSYFALEIEKYKPIDTSSATNNMIYRALEGFVAAVAPFNFTAIVSCFGSLIEI